MTELKMQELRAQAKAKGISVPLGTTKEELQKQLLASEPVSTEGVNPSIKETSNNIKGDGIPDEFKKLNLIPVRNLTKENVKIDHKMSQKRLLDISLEKKEELEREGYSLMFPLNTQDGLNNAIRRGADFVYESDGTPIKISAGQSNKRGELQYHVAMKIKKEILEEESRQQRVDAFAKKKMHQDGVDNMGMSDVSSEHVKFFTNKNNKL